MTMRKFLLAAFFISTHASAEPALDQLAWIIQRDQLNNLKPEALKRCAEDVPSARALLETGLVKDYCLVRHGARRAEALFLGVHLVARLERQGDAAAAKSVEALMAAVDRPDLSQQSRYGGVDSARTRAR